MTKELCIVHANCQGEPLIERLMTSPQFAARYRCELYTNSIRQPVPVEELARCDLLLYQHLGPKWNELASTVLIKALPASARSLCVPNMFFMGYWPLWSGRPGFDYRCDHLDEFIGLGLPPEETLLPFLHSDPATRYDLPARVARSVAHEREKESHTPVKYLDLILADSGRRRLFNTINHPGRELMDHAARGVLAQLGFAPDEAAMARLDAPFPEFELPINPKVARFFGWDFATADTQYRIYGRRMTFSRYAANYVMAARPGVSDFIGFLQGDHSAI
ncbi:MAG: WcbI family polysaccharide biosynthesis putative acetyltransferase [Pseudomonadota bacterium]